MITIEKHRKMAECLCNIRATIMEEYGRSGLPKSHKQYERKALQYIDKLRDALDNIAFRDHGIDMVYFPCSDKAYEIAKKEHLDLVEAFFKIMVTKGEGSITQRDLYQEYCSFIKALKLKPVSRTLFYSKARHLVYQMFGVLCIRGVYDGIRIRR